MVKIWISDRGTWIFSQFWLWLRWLALAHWNMVEHCASLIQPEVLTPNSTANAVSTVAVWFFKRRQNVFPLNCIRQSLCAVWNTFYHCNQYRPVKSKSINLHNRIEASLHEIVHVRPRLLYSNTCFSSNWVIYGLLLGFFFSFWQVDFVRMAFKASGTLFNFDIFHWIEWDNGTSTVNANYFILRNAND